ncbi:MAG: hypothetical protein ACD_32C00024G0001 [uncultured bacterium]|nr:MAG: hypothetical protein ACD_32C00024G0001 [uncultured bacterium]
MYDLIFTFVWKVRLTIWGETGTIVVSLIRDEAWILSSFAFCRLLTVINVEIKRRATNIAGIKTTERAGKATLLVLYSLITFS